MLCCVVLCCVVLCCVVLCCVVLCCVVLCCVVLCCVVLCCVVLCCVVLCCVVLCCVVLCCVGVVLCCVVLCCVVLCCVVLCCVVLCCVVLCCVVLCCVVLCCLVLCCTPCTVHHHMAVHCYGQCSLAAPSGHCPTGVGSGQCCLVLLTAVVSGQPWLLGYTATLGSLGHIATLQGAVGCGHPAVLGRTAKGQWGVEFEQHTTALKRAAGTESPSVHRRTAGAVGSGFLLYTATLQRAHGAVGSGSLSIHCRTVGDSGQWTFSTLLLYRGQWAVGLHQNIAALQCVGTMCLSEHCHTVGGSGQPASFNRPPRCTGTVGSGTVAGCRIARGSGQWVSFSTVLHRTGQGTVGILQYTAARQGAVGSGYPSVDSCAAWGSGQWVSFTKPSHCSGQWAVGLLYYIAALQRVVGSGPPSVHCRAARGSVVAGAAAVRHGVCNLS